MRPSVKAAVALADVATVAGVIALWQSDSAATASYLSKPSAVFAAIKVWLTNSTLLGYIPVTLWEAAAGMLIIPTVPIPGLDAVVDIGAPLALIWYWWTFFRDARRGPTEKRRP